MVTPAKECVMEPELFLNQELEALLTRLVAVDQTKWQALAELGLGPVPGRATAAPRKGGDRSR